MLTSIRLFMNTKNKVLISIIPFLSYVFMILHFVYYTELSFAENTKDIRVVLAIFNLMILIMYIIRLWSFKTIKNGDKIIYTLGLLFFNSLLLLPYIWFFEDRLIEKK